MIIPTDKKIAELCQYYHNEAVRLFVRADSDLKIDKRLTNHLAVICANIHFDLHDVKQSKSGLISKTIKILELRKSHLRVAKNMMAGAFDEKSDLTEKRRLRQSAELYYSIARKLTPSIMPGLLLISYLFEFFPTIIMSLIAFMSLSIVMVSPFFMIQNTTLKKQENNKVAGHLLCENI